MAKNKQAGSDESSEQQTELTVEERLSRLETEVHNVLTTNNAIETKLDQMIESLRIFKLNFQQSTLLRTGPQAK